ncbi:HAD family hydrolase [Halobacteriovorax sp. HLS]|uniref:HAD family hydrolase n=1 Tax=Halobacteriovorax sp. HLS TaxID=2234000 RepID=UPI000FD7EA3D|nr:HAD family hydrolase [Halobacteriovorax sp. HLS]
MKIVLLSLTLLLMGCNSKVEINVGSSVELTKWNETENTKGLIKYIKDSATEGHENYVPPIDRIAVFDNDGTLWSEQPFYYPVQALLDFYKEIIVIKHKKGISSVDTILKNGVHKASKKDLVFVLKTIQSGTTNEEFEQFVKLWLTTKKHKKFEKLYYKMTYAPMTELLNILKENDYEVFMVTGGETQFARVLNRISYQLPEQNIIGTTFSKKVIEEDGQMKVIRTNDDFFLNDKEGKIVSIVEKIGKVPTIAFGNSDGDFAMLKYTKLNSKYKTYAAVIRHDDEPREFLYDRETHVGKLDKVLDESSKYGIEIISMKKDFKILFE